MMGPPAGRRAAAKPDFLCIGAAKSGTTWLHNNLLRHPAFWMPPFKELDYFDRDPTYLGQLLGFGWPFREGRKRLIRSLVLAAGTGRFEQLNWYANYVLRPRSDAWYLSLFRPAGQRLTGDCSPHYSALGSERIADIKRLLPEVKIVYLLRDPVDRDWSSMLQHGPRSGRGDWEKLLERVNTPGWGGSGYLAHLGRWQEHIPASRIFVGFFDDIALDPTGLLTRLIAFLGGPGDRDLLPDGLDRVVNPGPGVPMPAEAELMLCRSHLAGLGALDARFPNAAPARWLARAEAVCAAGGEGSG